VLSLPSFFLQGYLRAGKALLLAEKPEKALDVYAYGLKTLGEQHPQKEVSIFYFRPSLSCHSPVLSPAAAISKELSVAFA
jgi:hypothetical protein